MPDPLPPSEPTSPVPPVDDAAPGADAPSGSSRRAFLAGAGAATVAGAAVAAGVGLPAIVAGAPVDSGSVSGSAGSQAGDAVVAYLHDRARSEVRLLTGEREVVVHDADLARALTRHVSGQES